ncbi:MAG: ABC transporter permease [Bacteroidetes bacterium]|nr:ABC transporter permease [Bacteroidota bacterium]
MFKTNLKLALRNLAKSKLHSFVNITGLSVGMAVAILIGLWIWSELSYNKQFKNYDRIAQVMQNQVFNGEIHTWSDEARQLAPALRNDYGRHFKYVVLSSWPGKHTLALEDKRLGKSGAFMEPDAPALLSLNMLKGTPNLKEPGNILLSASSATALFGDQEAVNKLMMIDNKMSVKVAGVYEDLPQNSNYKNLEFIAPWELMAQNDSLDKRRIGWGNSWFQVIVQVADNEDMNTASLAIRDVKHNAVDSNDARFKPVIFLQPMSRWHLYSEFTNGVPSGGNIRYIWLFGMTGFIVLLLACINFMNLSTARSEKRAREVGIRKAIGSMRGQLIFQFFTESLLVAFFAFAIALLIAELLLPFFSNLSGSELSIPWTAPAFWTYSLAFTIITGLLAGIYPALYLSSFRPVKVLKGVFRGGRLALIPRRALVVLQFTVSVTLIICTIVVFRQVQYARSRPVGYSNEGLVSIPIKTSDIKKHIEAFREDLIGSSGVEEITVAQASAASSYVTNNGLDWRTKPVGMQDEFTTVACDARYGKTMRWHMAQGRDFSPAIASDSLGFILNETAVKYMGFKNPIGETVRAFGKQYHVIGVVKDMVLQSPYAPVRPMIYYVDIFNRSSTVIARMNPALSAAAAIAKIESVFKKYDRANPFDYRFSEKEIEDKFNSEMRIGRLAIFFTVLAIFISCLGLFGMVSFMAEQRTKEIGVRKILGASIFNLWGLLSKDFVVMICVAMLIAMPLASWFMHGWLQNYYYRASLSWWIYAATALGALLITLLTISYQSIRAALANPVESLRTE